MEIRGVVVDLDGTVYLGDEPIPGSARAIERLREPDRVFGKPSEPTIRAVERALGHPPERLLVVGDGPDTDVAMGEAAGFHTAFVLSGRGSRADLAASDAAPDHVLDSLADLPGLLDGADGFHGETDGSSGADGPNAPDDRGEPDSSNEPGSPADPDDSADSSDSGGRTRG